MIEALIDLVTGTEPIKGTNEHMKRFELAHSPIGPRLPTGLFRLYDPRREEDEQ